MSFKTTFRLFLLVCVLGAALFLANYHSTVSERRSHLENSILPFQTEEIIKILLSAGTNSIELIKRSDRWFILSPVRARADFGKVAGILDSLDALESEDTITVEQLLERDLLPGDYGLDSPRAGILLSTENKSSEIRIGDDAALSRDSVYISSGESQDVLTVSRKLFALFPSSAQVLRDRSVITGDAAKTVRLEIERPGRGFVQLSRQDGQWFLRQPISARAENSLINHRLNLLYDLEVEDFFWDSAVDNASQEMLLARDAELKAKTEFCGLTFDTPVLRITVWTEGDSLGQELLLGKTLEDEDGKVYAKRREINSIYTISSRIVDVFSVLPDDLRDRTIFDIQPSRVTYLCLTDGEQKIELKRNASADWKIATPVQWNADAQIVRGYLEKICSLSVEAFVDGVATNLQEFGLAPPRYSFQLDDSESNADTVSETKGTHLLVAAVEDTDVYAKIQDRSGLLKISAGSLAWVTNGCVDPLAYRDRIMLALTPGNVRRISLKLNGSEQTIVRDDENAEWLPVNADKYTVNHDAVDRTLLAVSNLRALRIKARDPDNLASYGLVEPTMVLTFGLQREVGIENSLIIGFRAENDGIYAMVRGQDLIFVLETALVDLLAGSILKNSDATDLSSGASSLDSKDNGGS